ncbi:hypothetical protein AYI70_g12190 [Smittium culicis]|uniref:Uncharacterized protein n=1 Tax=Smittium culicis TaxID=133412 RepID=A0A1R1WYH2_9FUNG|nr:hypothetical protein AYI70_g12190 [Smittium culicis]
MGTCQQINSDRRNKTSPRTVPSEAKSLNCPHTKKEKITPYHKIITRRPDNFESSPSNSSEIQLNPAPDGGAPRSCENSVGRGVAGPTTPAPSSPVNQS